MIDQGLAAAVLTYASVLAGIGAVVLLTLAAWWVRSPLTKRIQHPTTSLRRAADDFRRSGDNGAPHPAH